MFMIESFLPVRGKFIDCPTGIRIIDPLYKQVWGYGHGIDTG